MRHRPRPKMLFLPHRETSTDFHRVFASGPTVEFLIARMLAWSRPRKSKRTLIRAT